MKKKKTGVRIRSAPRRSAAQWAREFAEALALGPGVTISRTEFLAAAKKDSRLRERRPDSVVRIVEAGAKVSGVSLEEWVLLGKSCSWLLVRKPEAIGMILKELEDVLGIKRRDAVRLVKKVPALVSFGRGRIEEKFGGLCGVFDFDKDAVRRLVLRCPDLLVRKTGLLAGRMEEESLLFGFSGEDYRKLLRRDPRLLLRDEKALLGFLKSLGKRWRLTEGEVRALVMKAPGILLSGSLERIDGNVNKLARGLGWKKAEGVQAVMKFPVLAYQNPERVIGNFRKGASVLGVEREVLAKAVLRMPSFLARKVEGWGRRMRLVRRIAAALGKEVPAWEVLEGFPTAMTYGADRLLQRYVVARLGLWTWNWQTLLTFSDVKIRERLKDYFGEHREREALRQALVRRGLL